MKNEKVKSELMKVWQSVELLESVMAEFEKNGKAIDYEVCKKKRIATARCFSRNRIHD